MNFVGFAWKNSLLILTILLENAKVCPNIYLPPCFLLSLFSFSYFCLLTQLHTLLHIYLTGKMYYSNPVKKVAVYTGIGLGIALAFCVVAPVALAALPFYGAYVIVRRI